MASRSSHNRNNAGVKRILQEARELSTDPSTDYHAAPLEDDIFEWHCTMRGPAGTEFEGGLYHFRIQLPSEYPFRPPSIMMLTPNGRFELNTKICISFTSYHEELWQPAWGIRTAIIALQGFFPLKGEAAVGVGAVEYPVAERRRLAKLSQEWKCPHCEMTNLEILADAAPPSEKPPKVAGDTSDKDPTNADYPSLNANIESGDSGRKAEQGRPTPTPAPASPVLAQHCATYAPTPMRPQQSLSVASQQSIRRPLPSHPSRPPLLLDGAIVVLFTMVIAIVCKKIL